MLREEPVTDPERLARFEKEARAASAFNHPNIITIHDIRKHGATPFIVMELVEGKKIREMVSEDPIPTQRLIDLATQLAEGLSKAHTGGIIHRDRSLLPRLRIPLILHFPGIVPEGQRVHAMVSTLDILPTILDIAQVSFPSALEGSSLVPLLNRSKDELHDKLYFQNDQHQMAITNGRLKLIAYPRTEEKERRDELYDMWKDPEEIEDRYAESEPNRTFPLRAGALPYTNGRLATGDDPPSHGSSRQDG